MFLPPNVTSILQPMGQEVINLLKTQYRKLPVLQMLRNLEKGKNNGLSVLDAILLISDAWGNVTQTTISNCFLCAGFKDVSSSPLLDDSKDDLSLAMLVTTCDDNDNIPLAQLAQKLFNSSVSRNESKEFISVDNNVWHVCQRLRKIL